MAKWRAIHRDTSTSGQVNRLDEFGQLLWDRMILWSDDWGVITGDLFELKLKTMPASQRAPEDFEVAITHMEEIGLIRRYQPDGYGPLIWLVNFDEHQPSSIIGKRTEPKRPLHPDDIRFMENPGNSPKIQENPGNSSLDKTRQDKNKQDKRREDQTTTDKSTPVVDDPTTNPSFESNLQILLDSGVAEPTASECAAYPHVSPSYLEGLVAEMGSSAGRGKPLRQGWLVTQIRNRRAPPWR